MASKNNNDRPKAEREYFDRPVDYMHQGFMFSPIHRRPIELLGEMRFTQMNTADGQMRNTFSGMSKNSSINSMIMYDKKNSLVVPITNGMNNEQLFNSAYRRPRDLSRKGAELSVDYG